jgi:deazaflavin-dependent oxidoreductase (nitroreductase family)
MSRKARRATVPLVKRSLTKLHAAIYRRTGGRLLGRMGGQPVLLLETIGRHSGRARTTPVQYLPHGEALVVVAANGGAAVPPAWRLNLRAHPMARVHCGARAVEVTAREASGPERAALWQRLTLANRYLDRVARTAGHELPVLILEPSENERPAC